MQMSPATKCWNAYWNLQMKITQEIQRVLQSTPPELMGDILSDGIIVTGASAQIYGFDKLIARKTEIPVRIADNPATCVVEGAGKAIQFIDDMDKRVWRTQSIERCILIK